MTTRFLIGVAVGAVGAWLLARRNSGNNGAGVGGASSSRRMGRSHGSAGAGRYRL